MATLLVTAFGAFPGAPHNPSEQIMRLLQRDGRRAFARAGLRLTTAVLPVAYDIAPHLDALVAREKPDAILHLGLAARRRQVSIEMRARNRVTTVKPDAFGRHAQFHAYRSGRSHRRSTWNARRLRAALRRERIDASVSQDAGDYVCNATLWRSLEVDRAPAIFVHVPDKRRLPPSRMAVALARILPGATRRALRMLPTMDVK